MTVSDILTGPTLVLDAGGARIFGGILKDGAWTSWNSSEQPALESLFSLTRSWLDQSNLSLNQIRSFAFCDGPGSTLGLRLASAALLTWQQLAQEARPVFHYHSLHLAWYPLLQKGVSAEAWLITDYRKNCWLGAPAKKPDSIAELDTVTLSEIPKEIYYLPQRKSWMAPPGEIQTVYYPFEQIPRFFTLPGAGKIESQPLLAVPGKSDYRRWAPERHRAPPTT